MARRPSIGIAGAGPAGLTAAIAAARLGFDVSLYEQAPDFRRIGGGVLVHSNGLRVLDALGLLGAFEPHVRFCDRIDVLGSNGRLISAVEYARLPIPQNRCGVVLRHALHEFLHSAAVAEGIDVRFAHRCRAATIEGERVALAFESGRTESFDAVLACDGINSRVRDALGLPAKRRVIGEAYLRGVARLRPAGGIREIWGRGGRRFGICPLPGDETYFYASVPLGGWDRIREHHLDAWIEEWRSVAAEAVPVLRSVDDWSAVNYSELAEIALERWHEGPVFVLGDAAHAMTPNLGQGANSAMVDAMVLVRMLARERDAGRPLSAAGKGYDSLRRPFVTRIQTAARQVGQFAAWSGPLSPVLRDGLMRTVGRLDAINRPSQLLGAGWNPAENDYLVPLPGR